MNKNQKLIAFGTVGLLAAFLLYRWHQGRQGATTTTSPTDQAASDFASLAGTEQADMAALQGRESQDIAGLGGQLATVQSSVGAAPTQSDLAAVQSQETADIAGLAGQLTGLGTALTTLAAAPRADAPPSTVPIAAGHQPASRAPVRPAGHPHAIWSGPVKPPGSFKGIGGGWWAPTAAPAKHNPHSSVHQPGNAGHNGKAPAGHAVAPVNHAPKSSAIRKPAAGSPGHKPPPPPPKPAPKKKTKVKY